MRSRDGKFISRRTLAIIAVVSLLLLSLVAFTSHLSVNSFASSSENSSPLCVKYNTTTSTHLSASTINLGDNVTDNVTVTGSFGTPTGTVTFQVKFDGGSWTTYDTKTLSSGKAKSIAYVPSQAGSYYFRAIYNGDSNYYSSQSCDTSEPLCVINVKHNSTTSTHLSASTINLGESVTDNVTVTGSYGTPTGSVTFQVKFDGGSWTSYDNNKNLVNGKTTSIAYVPSSAGQYWFRALYSGDNNYNDSQSCNDNEPLLVNAVKHGSTTSTLLFASTIDLGGSVTDNVTVTGSFGTPTGTVTFQVKFDGGSWTTYDTKSLSSGTATSVEYVPLAAGQYWFRAIYSGDTNYNGSTSPDENEPLLVNPLNLPHNAIVTELSSSTITLGENVTDTVTVTGLGGSFPMPTGTVDFQVKFDDGSWVTYDTESLSGGTAMSIEYVPLAAGQYWFRAVYSGDSNYNGSQSDNESEPLMVNKHDTTTVTVLYPTTQLPIDGVRIDIMITDITITLGENVTDTVTVTGLGSPFPMPTGTVDFQVKFDDGSWVTYDTESLSSGIATSVEYVPLAAGQYWFRAIYGGDSNYNGSQSSDESEPLGVNPPETHDTTTTTELSASTMTLPGSVTDTVMVTGLVSPLPTGTVEFQVKFDGESWVMYDTETLSGGTVTSIAYVPSSVGQYWFRALYSGDENYNGSQSSDESELLTVNENENEPLWVNKGPSTTTTVLSASTIIPGDNVTDTVTVTGLGDPFPVPTGTVTFQVKIDDGSWVTYDTGSLSGGTATSVEYVPLVVENYWFRAIYSGDNNYNGSQSSDESEPLTVIKLDTTTTTQLSASTIDLGGNVTDTVTVTGLISPLPTGTVDFQVKIDDGSWVTYDTETLSGGTATSVEYIPLVVENYWFRAIYSGDNYYNESTSPDDNELLTVNRYRTPESNIVTVLSASIITLGENVTDTVTVTGLGGSFPLPTGTVTFQVKFDGESWVTYDTETLSGGTATSVENVPLAAGQYWFRAVYSGDSNYENSQSPDNSESLTVNRHDTTTTTLLSESIITLGDNVTDTATVTGLGSPFPLPTGTVTFQVKFDDGSWTIYDTETLVNGMATSIAYVPSQAGNYWFQAIYSGDNNYYGSQSDNESEPLMVNKHDTTTTTELIAIQPDGDLTITLGESVIDTATVTGLVSPLLTGTVTFQVKFDDGSWTIYDTESLVNGMATSIAYVPSQAGNYWFQAIYSGDNNYYGSQSDNESEPLTVNKHDTTTTTLLSASVITLGENVTDTATVTTGLPNPPYPLPTGTVTFQVKFDDGSWVTYDIENLVNGTATSIEYVPLQAGQYYFGAIYSGDSNYNGSQSL